MAKTLDKIATFFKVSPWQQLATFGLSVPMATIGAYEVVANFSQGKEIEGIGCAVISLIFTYSAIKDEGNAVNLMRKYKLTKRELTRKGWSEKLVDEMSNSYCDINVIQVASDHMGYGKQTKEYLEDNGRYRSPFSTKSMGEYMEFLDNNKP